MNIRLRYAFLTDREGFPTAGVWKREFGRWNSFLMKKGLPDGKKEGSFTLRLNGRTIYMNGYNWVPADVMYGSASEETYAHLIRLAKEAGVKYFPGMGRRPDRKGCFLPDVRRGGNPGVAGIHPVKLGN